MLDAEHHPAVLDGVNFALDVCIDVRAEFIDFDIKRGDLLAFGMLRKNILNMMWALDTIDNATKRVSTSILNTFV